MALIVLQHSTVDSFDIDPDYAALGASSRILAGMLVGLDSNGYLAKASGTVLPLGIAGDSMTDEYQTTAYSASLVVSPTGATRWTSNRVSDMFNETLASGKMTVYFGSGKFATDQYYIQDSWSSNRGAALYVAANAHGLFTLNSNTSRVVGYVLAAPTDYPSGVPGVDDPHVDNSMSLGTYLTVQLLI